MLPYVLPKSGHVRLHRMWAFAIHAADLSCSEHIHVLYCDDCRTALGVCLQAETFGSVLKTLNREDDSHSRDDDDQSKAG